MQVAQESDHKSREMNIIEKSGDVSGTRRGVRESGGVVEDVVSKKWYPEANCIISPMIEAVGFWGFGT